VSLNWANAPDQFLTVGGVRLEYACHGPSPDEAPTLVLLHEGLGCVALWRDFPSQLAAATGLGVFVYSRAGYGQSDSVPLPRPLDYMTREAEDVLGQVLDAAGIRQAVLVGHSDGATIAAIYGGSVSDLRVRGLVLIAPHFFTESEGLAAIRAAGDAFRNADLRQKLAFYHANVDAAFLGWHDAWTDPGFEAWNVADVIDHLRIPVLALQGRDDAYGTLAQISEVEERMYAPVETVILDGCGHAPHREKPGETVAAVSEFCARLMRLEQESVPLG
jgi:pimeloyl-ACP methyl ester carboxylesterase